MIIFRIQDGEGYTVHFKSIHGEFPGHDNWTWRRDKKEKVICRIDCTVKQHGERKEQRMLKAEGTMRLMRYLEAEEGRKTTYRTKEMANDYCTMEPNCKVARKRTIVEYAEKHVNLINSYSKTNYFVEIVD